MINIQINVGDPNSQSVTKQKTSLAVYNFQSVLHQLPLPEDPEFSLGFYRLVLQRQQLLGGILCTLSHLPAWKHSQLPFLKIIIRPRTSFPTLQLLLLPAAAKSSLGFKVSLH